MKRRSFLTHSAAAGLAAGLPLRANAAEAVLLRDMYANGMDFSDLAQSLEGQRVTLEGYMAPPLKANSTFFVLTKMPMTVCPFCETEAEWPDDIAAVYTSRIYDVVYYSVKLLTTGRLELGTERDEETGFVSRLRLVDASFDRA
ncbi:twin-arginine translocation signal domain-containing protein [Pseudoroseicyclus tamaricis]|uniref:Twin-arginine translocation signal domain-containing protein n=1 Tax=Pseudoroseicyclus tamaricis TaxID=2705421 RepID=A0A6B2JKL5_9RHOB|nr:twin-arginine translocation signal domain-containing protein [Pseudoroseicyclus tamaricis]NDV02033.1 twin-arginine translocation signal domain-containing protein [Pseudoroseicyclus tamaricis]